MVAYVTGPLTRSDVAELARIHQRAFPGFFLSTLGTPFLRQFYSGFLRDPTGVSVVLRDVRDGRPVGAAVGTLDPSGFFARLLRRRWLQFGAASAVAVIRSPSTAPRLLRAMNYRGQGATRTHGALLSSICLSPEAQGTGAGSSLLRAWQHQVASRGGASAHLTTDADNNQSVNAFYDRHGWQCVETFMTPQGRRMHLRVVSHLT